MMEKEEHLLRKRILELARISHQRDIPIHTGFLNLYEQTVFHSLVSSLPSVSYELVGGYELAERKVVCFLPSYEESCLYPPVTCIRVKPVNAKFAEKLTHRDYLGAIMNLGIDRGKIGDILLEGQTGYVMCLEELAEYIAGELGTVRHTNMCCEVCPPLDIQIKPEYEPVSGSVASLRLDNILALAYGMSRTKAVPYIEGERVFINGRLIRSNSTPVKEGDVVSVRGLGKFIYRGVCSETKKGRLYVTLDKYC